MESLHVYVLLYHSYMSYELPVFTISQCSDSLNLRCKWVAHGIIVYQHEIHVHHVVKFYMNLFINTNPQNLKRLHNTELILKPPPFVKSKKQLHRCGRRKVGGWGLLVARVIDKLSYHLLKIKDDKWRLWQLTPTNELAIHCNKTNQGACWINRLPGMSRGLAWQTPIQPRINCKTRPTTRTRNSAKYYVEFSLQCI